MSDTPAENTGYSLSPGLLARLQSMGAALTFSSYQSGFL